MKITRSPSECLHEHTALQKKDAVREERIGRLFIKNRLHKCRQLRLLLFLAWTVGTSGSSNSRSRGPARSKIKANLDTIGGSAVGKKRKRKLTSPSVSSPSVPTTVDLAQVVEYKGNDITDRLHVQALLVPRHLNLRKIIQSFCFIALFISFGACVATSGRPYCAAVFQLIHQHIPAPMNYIPSQTELFLARKLAASSRDILPPKFLPSAVPLLSLLASVAVWLACCVLLPQWFIGWEILLKYNKYDLGKSDTLIMMDKHGLDRKRAAVLVHIPWEARIMESDGKPNLILALHASDETQNDPSDVDQVAPYYFDLNHRRKYTDLQTSRTTDGGPKLHLKSLKDLTCTKTIGLRTRHHLDSAQLRYGPYASFSLPEPTVRKALQSRLTSPLSVLQLVGKLLQALEESLGSSIFGIITTVGQHWFSARQAIISAKELAQEVQGNLKEVGSQKVWVLRPSSAEKLVWIKMSSVEVLPGDVFILSDTEITMPVDALLLDGTVVTNEAVLTGESVPQSKVPLEEIDSQSLDMIGRHRSAVLFAGTTVLYHSNTSRRKTKGLPKIPQEARQGVHCLALRTGSYSSRGDLMRALSKSRVGAISNPQSERDALRLITSLSVFAAIACWRSLTTSRQETSAFRRIIQCTRIGIASIPSNIPMALSGIAQSCAAQLRKDSDVVCSEPGALLTAATIDVVVFDKTGTLTADTQSLSSIIPTVYPSINNELMIDSILGGCHSLINLKNATSENKLIGDPLDLASLRYSGWTYSQREDCFTKTTGNHTGMRLWQIKTFPFDPTRRTSSAIVLVIDTHENVRIMEVMKGSPDKIEDLVIQNRTSLDWYQTRNSQLGKEGMRTIAMAAKVLSENDHATSVLFPKGIPTSSDEVDLVLENARQRSHELRRDDVEQIGFEFTAFACFIASIRPSTLRIINELNQASIPVTMLTGDSIEAAITTCKTAGIITNVKVAILDVKGKNLVWKIQNEGSVQTMDATTSTWSEILSLSSRNLCSLATTGAVIEYLESKNKESVFHFSIKSNLSKFSIIARASPKQKAYTISTMKNDGGKTVLMCGDGVNDVAAMKLADVSVALLNGYGDERESNQLIDVEDERRREKIADKRIGSNRKALQMDNMSNAGVGESRAASRARVKTKIDAAMFEIKQQAATRQGIRDLDSRDIRFTNADIRAQFSKAMSIGNEERARSKLLQKGGAGAARILAENERRRQQLNATVDLGEHSEHFDIKPGEASLASPFSCLRPAIDGVDGLIRVGVAASACALSTQQGIALSCLMSAYNLATLYRDGFRYGKHMFNVEMMFYMAIDQAGYQALCNPRPHLSAIRAPASLFHPSSIFSVIGQAFVHLMTLSTGVRIANSLESGGKKISPILVRWQSRVSTTGAERRLLIEALADAITTVPLGDEDEHDWFGRPKFRPNFATNVVFLFSIFQSGVAAVINHKGKPFCGSFLESRKLSLAVSAALLFSVAGVAETMPTINAMLELRPMPSRGARYLILSLFIFDILGCWLVDFVCTNFASRKEIRDLTKRRPENTAADLEATLLDEEERENRKLVIAMVTATVILGLL